MKRSFSEGDLSKPLSIRPSSDYEVPENDDDDYYMYISKMDVEYLAGYDRQFRVNYKGKECLVEFYDNPTHLEVIDRLKGHKEFTQLIDCQAVTPYGSITKYAIITPLYEAEDPPKHEIPYYTKKLIQAVQKLRRRKVLVRSMAPEFIVCRDGEVTIFNFDDALDLKKVHDPADLEWDDDYAPPEHHDGRYDDADRWCIGYTLGRWLTDQDIGEFDIKETYESTRKDKKLGKLEKEGFNLMRKLCRENPDKRISLEDALKHPFLTMS